MITKIRHLQDTHQELFAIELASGRVIQIYNPYSVATDEHGLKGSVGSVGILHGDGVFAVISADKIVSVSSGVHQVEKERIENRMAWVKNRISPAE